MSPLTLKKIRRFKSIKRGYYSFILLTIIVLISLCAQLLINKKAIIVKYNSRYFFPVLSSPLPGKVFDLGYDYETNYRQLAEKQEKSKDNFVIMPIVPYDPYENDFIEGEYPPHRPSFSKKHFLGTDMVGRDVLARLVYGFIIAFFFSLCLLIINYTIGIFIGSFMGYVGGKFDIFFQRIIEIWSNTPVLYIIIIISSIVVPDFFILIIIMAFFGWVGMTWIIRTVTYKEKERDYVLAAKVMGCSSIRIIFKHIIPNTISIIVTFVPFSISTGIVTLTSLDYLGFGLPAPTPSWGELLSQGYANPDAWWIGGSVIAAMVITLTAVTFVGEAVREAFDPKNNSIYS